VSLPQVNGCWSGQHEISLERLLPHLAGVVVETAALTGGRLCIWARARAGRGVCREGRVPAVRRALAAGA
jgi:hypothetical protein